MFEFGKKTWKNLLFDKGGRPELGSVMAKMRKAQILLGLDQYQKLAEIARREGGSVSSLVRQAVRNGWPGMVSKKPSASAWRGWSRSMRTGKPSWPNEAASRWRSIRQQSLSR